ncbi:related to ferroportin 1 [Ustilago bromivora]|uniref:Solute carrier family 40 member n=1 Tax=Ustilago bromivora TaxID=307758 RepID=A0A1K0G276_9BASI|nr:related to ferroportin 1 [Ustilago bromivora]SYW77882.1 related to ferroportin 1 [Ustilago bromivora]
MSSTEAVSVEQRQQDGGGSESIALQPLPSRLDRQSSRTCIARSTNNDKLNPYPNPSNLLEQQQSQPQDTPPTNDADANETESTFGNTPSTGPSDLDLRGTLLLAIQHASSSWGYRSTEFAYPLFMIQLFTNTLLPASIYGFVTTAGAVLLSNNVGRIIDTYSHTKLRTLRAMILSQKLLVGFSYALFFLLFSSSILRTQAQNGGKGPEEAKANVKPWSKFCSDNGAGDSPLFVSALTSGAGYRWAGVALLGVNAVTGVFELVFVGIVYRRFPSLAADERVAIARKEARNPSSSTSQQSQTREQKDRMARVTKKVASSVLGDIGQQYQDWKLFIRLPIFLTSLCISLLYMSVLSFDPTFIAYLKSETLYSDAFIAGMRAVGVVTGLIGTFIMPILEKKIGLVRTGSYSLFAELIPLIPAVVSLWITGSPTDRFGLRDKRRPSLNTGLLFSGLALSRIGLWSFDLTQLAMIQTALSPEQLGPDAGRKNALMALQFSLQNVFDLGHYGLTLGWNGPEEFKYAAIVSLAAVGAATLIYLVFYARRVRGHVVHLERLQRLLSRKER